jgi:uncharacterized membrane protein YfcA
LETITVIGYAAAFLIGIVLALVDSILTVPVTAMVYSLFVVRFLSGVGAIQYFKKGNTAIKIALLFSFPSVVAVYTTRRYVLSIIPETVFEIGEFTATKNILIKVFFAVLMIGAAASMLITKRRNS